MREILFRGKRLDNGEWVYGFYVATGDERIILPVGIDRWGGAEFSDCHFVDPATVGQYTGLKDKNGKRIFEGDVVTMPAYHGGKHKSVVYFKNGKFAVDGSNYHFKDIATRGMEVIGNIHDPELLDGGGADG